MTDAQLYTDTFNITSINSQKYDRVSRIVGSSNDQSTSISLDINHELYPVGVGENLQVSIATTLNLDGRRDDEKGWREQKGQQETTLADMFDYVAYGKIYKFEGDADGDSVKAYISFGGLLLFFEGPFKKLTPLRTDMSVYLLLKK
ncbi:DNA-directed RNA polymerases and 3 polypeptide [Aulographum hederae CBS 113979]|uniref:DNA-directed RNA polymerases I, II, and III subunit RPABC3 n=1 Tax=Aulographum hederae CBS 113979 TaxID=1176131 RepID=A0A6G1GMP8_9PEZI|nr:DNA-directed RNA polymerases and 3 polypeptide [Aulographum hederae CBS 113979]